MEDRLGLAVSRRDADEDSDRLSFGALKLGE
jgi:hypothetical protein